MECRGVYRCMAYPLALITLSIFISSPLFLFARWFVIGNVMRANGDHKRITWAAITHTVIHSSKVLVVNSSFSQPQTANHQPSDHQTLSRFLLPSSHQEITIELSLPLIIHNQVELHWDWMVEVKLYKHSMRVRVFICKDVDICVNIVFICEYLISNQWWKTDWRFHLLNWRSSNSIGIFGIWKLVVGNSFRSLHLCQNGNNSLLRGSRTQLHHTASKTATNVREKVKAQSTYPQRSKLQNQSASCANCTLHFD